MFEYLIDDDLCEKPFLKKIENELLQYSNITNFNIYVTDVRHLTRLPIVPNKKTVIILLSDEYFNVPAYIKEVKCIFKTGVSPANTENNKNLFAFPLGYTNKFVMRENLKTIKERPIDVFFSGQVLTDDRREMLQEIIKFKKNNPNLNIIHNVSPSFLNGFSGETYSELMYNSKICLCPAGTTMPETFRYYEAFKAGCTVFTKNYLPSTWLYKKAPVVRMENWNQLEEAVTYFLNNPALIEKYTNNVTNYQQNIYEPKAIAKFMYDTLFT